MTSVCKNGVIRRVKAMNNKSILIVILLVLVLAGGWFYWFQWRPAKARSYCAYWALNKAKEGDDQRYYQFDVYDEYFDRCMREKGLK